MSLNPLPSKFPPTEPSSQATAQAFSISGQEQKARWLLIGADDSTLAALRHAAGALPVQRLDNLLLALGDMGVHGQPQVIFADTAFLRHSWPSTLNALRRLAPQARLILLNSVNSNLDRRDIPLGVHAMLDLPITPQQVQQAIQPATKAAEKDKDQSSYFRFSDDQAVAAPSELPAVPDDELGDVDLLDHLLHHRPNLAGLAMRLVRTRSGIPDLSYTPQPADNSASNPQAVASGTELLRNAPVTAPGPLAQNGNTASGPGTTVSVNYQGHCFGLLHSSTTQPPQRKLLQVWAQWLGTWLATEHRMQEQWKLAYQDELTGLWNRRYFNQYLRQLLERASSQRFRVTLMVFDIDDFKQFNDRCGHDVGDQVLQETARLMQSVVRENDVVARIGGDEFAVIFWDAQAPRRPNSQHPDDVQAAARRFQQAIAAKRFPKLIAHNLGGLTISGGLAGFPWDGRTPEELIHLADQMALQSKRQGKNALTFGPGALRSEDSKD